MFFFSFKGGVAASRVDDETLMLDKEKHKFDGVLGPESTQEDVYRIALKGAIRLVLQGNEKKVIKNRRCECCLGREPNDRERF